MRRAFALLLLFFAFDASAEDKPLVPFEIVKTGVLLLRVRGVSARAENGQQQAVQYRGGVFRLRLPAGRVSVDLNAGIPLKGILLCGRGLQPAMEAIALSPSHYLLSIDEVPGGDFELTWEPDTSDVPEMAVFIEGNDGMVMIVPPLWGRLSDVRLQFDDPSAEVSRQRDGDLVIVTVKFGSPTGRVIASGRISGQEWQDTKRVCEGVCESR